MRLLYIVLIIVLFTGYLFAQQTANVIIVVIDGARYSETFGDTVHKYIPKLWNDLRPQGTIYTSFYIEGYTATNPGHSSILTGKYQYIANDGSERPHTPTVFEYYRKEKNAPIEDCYVILGKDKLDILTHSDHPDYNCQYRASIKYSTSEYDDKITLDNFRNVISSSHPRLAIINFAQTDNAGHSGVWSDYVNSIRNADSLIYELWNIIQSDSVYQGKTTMIVTGDHGRHLDNVKDGFKSHGDNCDGCRHVSTMIIGPDTPRGYVDSNKTTQIDIAPTIGKLLKFVPIYSEGSVINSAIITGIKSESYAQPPAIKLMGNFPNPFNPSTTLQFSLPCTDYVTLKIYNLIGEEVANLFNGVLTPGTHNVEWDATGLSSGVYVYTLTTNFLGGSGEKSTILNKIVLNK